MSYAASVNGLYVLIILVLIYGLLITGSVFSYIAITHSIKKRIVVGESFSAGKIFLWTLGWGFAAAYSLGIATIIYFFVQRSEINATKARCEQVLQSIWSQNRVAQYPEYYPPQQTQFPPQQ